MGWVLVCSTLLILGLRLKGTISLWQSRKTYSDTHNVSQGLGSELVHPFCPRSTGQGEPHAHGQSQQVEKYTFAYTTMGQRRWIKAGVLKN